jgi:trigger factor
MQIEIKNLDKCAIEITGEIKADVFEGYKEQAVRELSKEVKIDGFRPGHIPEDVLLEKIGEDALLNMMAELALQKAYPIILKENGIDAIGRPAISITKIARNNPLCFKIKTATLPEIVLADYKKISSEGAAKKIDEKEFAVEDKEVDQAIDYLRKARAKSAGDSPQPSARNEQTTPEANRPEGGKDDPATPSNGVQQGPNQPKADEQAEPVLPELNDEFAKAVGKFNTVDELKKAIKENLGKEKKNKAQEKKRIAMLDTIIAGSKIEVPQILIESESHKMISEMKANITQTGLTWEKYLEHIKKEEKDLIKDQEKDAVKRVKLGLVINEIAKEEDIDVLEEEVVKEAEKLVEFYKTSGQNIDPNRAKEYIYGILRNQKVFAFLEGKKDSEIKKG